MPIISIVVPVYKTEQYLRRCVDSIDTYRQFMQRYPLANSFEGIMRWLIKHRHYKLLFLINCWVLPITLRYRY